MTRGCWSDDHFLPGYLKLELTDERIQALLSIGERVRAAPPGSPESRVTLEAPFPAERGGLVDLTWIHQEARGGGTLQDVLLEEGPVVSPPSDDLILDEPKAVERLTVERHAWSQEAAYAWQAEEDGETWHSSQITDHDLKWLRLYVADEQELPRLEEPYGYSDVGLLGAPYDAVKHPRVPMLSRDQYTAGHVQSLLGLLEKERGCPRDILQALERVPEPVLAAALSRDALLPLLESSDSEIRMTAITLLGRASAQRQSSRKPTPSTRTHKPDARTP